MPKSKRDKKVSLTKTNKKGLVLKQKIIEEIRKSLKKYEHVFLFTVDNMRNTKLKDLRNNWKDSRFFFGKNKVMAIALGRTKSDEVEDQLNLLSKKLKGQCGLLMTNRDVPEVLQWFEDFRETEYARSGFIATRDVILPAGPLQDFSHTIEPHLRRLGLPTSLERGVIHLIKEYQVCKKGLPLTPEQASILKLLGIQMAQFKLLIKCHWTKGKGFHKDLEVHSDDEVENEHDDNVLEDEEMEEDET
ncbi:mRNA turnover protein 4 homolog [Plodia interpunctella]|uniref:mRNA turnover protein 4 homolog n=1 Tax=Plodia interpunctella TaxID=58824 RepID=UPI002367EDC2|nr:mRNA turnover protein 4 homolog [Plodia interpunctella]